MELGKFYTGWKAQDDGGYTYPVEVVGSGDREPGVHASELSCQLKLVYNLLRTQQHQGDRDINMQMRFNLGHAIHGMLQHEFACMSRWLNGAITFQAETGIHPGIGGVAAQYNIHSHTDGIFSFWHEEQVYLRVGLEIKSESAKQFDKLVKPRDYHMEQVNTYMRALDLPLMWILYYNKSNSNITPSTPPWLFQFDKSLWTRTVEPKIVGALDHASKGTLPPRTEGYYCKWCPYRWTCKPPRLHQTKYGPAGTMHNPGALRI